MLKTEDEIHPLKDNEDFATVISSHASRNAKERVDPLTGKRIELIWQNGFSGFKEESMDSTCNTVSGSEGHHSWKLHPKLSKQSLFHHQEIGNAKGICEIYDGKKRLLEVANFKGESKQNESSWALRELYKTWKNPVFGVSKEKQLEAQVDLKVQSKQRKLGLGTTTFTFSKEHLAKIDVIGQVDDKFIACTLFTVDDGKKKERILLLLDQHAAHERIQLEALQDEFLQGLQKNEKGLSVDCKEVIPPLTVSLSVPIDCSLKKLRYMFEKIGIHYIVKSERVVEDKNYVELSLIAMPALFIKRSESRGKNIHTAILEESAIKDLFYDYIDQHQDTPSSASVIPPCINNVLCSYACHSAIRFGDSLTMLECTAIVKSLAKCRLPFQCAHGRPSIVPLITLDKYS